MKAVLTCDDVFEVLTREPFPAGGSDDEVVESHLAVCHECRQLAEAFRPAVGLFHEAISEGLEDELPSYRGRLMPMIDSPPRPGRHASPHARINLTMIVLASAGWYHPCRFSHLGAVVRRSANRPCRRVGCQCSHA